MERIQIQPYIYLSRVKRRSQRTGHKVANSLNWVIHCKNFTRGKPPMYYVSFIKMTTLAL